ncbi:MAG TPA: hypothetical protein VFO26_12215 [Gaiella sp.]|uniref:hypothetical protein n=1 Tax=Gaiella sp. TaxID=2663207 RepID=UPI002D809258|nr:hypothetical protein [Gaiella sp.]HET9288311.1 hypothetical protein [Gaiella sp.]
MGHADFPVPDSGARDRAGHTRDATGSSILAAEGQIPQPDLARGPARATRRATGARVVASLVLAIFSAIALLLAGAYLGSRERTCAVVPSSQGNVVLCSNDWADKVGQ